MALIVTCPACQKRLQVPDELIGKNVQCPECKGTFEAAVDAPKPTSTTSRPAPKTPEWEKPPEKPSKLSKRKRLDDEDDDEDDRPRRRRDEDDEDEEEDDRPRRRRKSRRHVAPHRGGMILTFGILAILGCVWMVFGPMAWVMGGNDLREMEAGRMDREGEGMTKTGRILGMIATILYAVLIVGACLLGALGGIMGGARQPMPKRRF